MLQEIGSGKAKRPITAWQVIGGVVAEQDDGRERAFALDRDRRFLRVDERRLGHESLQATIRADRPIAGAATRRRQFNSKAARIVNFVLSVTSPRRRPRSCARVETSGGWRVDGGNRDDDRASISERAREAFDRLTARERKAAQTLLANYPTVGLAPVAEFAERAHVSAPTVLRFVAKLGFQGYPDFQRHLREELEAQLASPLAKPSRGGRARNPQRAAIDPFVESAIANLQNTFRHVGENEFMAIVDLLCDRRRAVHLIGGRFTDALARYFAAHLGLVRPAVRHVPSGIGVWRDRLLDMNRRDVLIVFDVRRYQEDVVSFARKAAERGASIVLVTDQWMSPLARQAAHVLACRITAPSRWDSGISLLAVVEALTAAVTDRLGEFARERMEELERLR
ncbi:MAG: MurR/RpiR family transcriptional regulator [Hyphomicrobiales bacterium]|nr:MurR/RpiR family transcriptional regulator [Hyphomicrobiales bacterium]MDE2017707.1 MurR/RpiR family transcriptional regulator [Hyphomicrobiales bacterium]